jgi:protein gp37
VGKTLIPWTDVAWNALTWNCNKVSPGCKHCYALAHSQKYPQNSAGGEFLGAPKWRTNATADLKGIKAGNTVFVNTHSDTFHEKNTLGVITDMFRHMNQRPDLIFLLLTKRPQHALTWSPAIKWTENIWLGTSVESPEYMHRLDALRAVPVSHRFVSFEPLLQYIPQAALRPGLQNIDWAIVGGESGEDYRPFSKQWAADIQQVAAEMHVPFYFKQGSAAYPDSDRDLFGKTYDEFPAAFQALHDQYRVNAVQASLF